VRLEAGRLGDQTIQVLNPTTRTVQLVLERIPWDEDILTAASVTNWQEFRDLFSAEVISPQEQVTVGNQVILFTDLRGSTAMYNGIGDAPAYALVRDHFQVLTAATRRHHGGIVKTIGDAVMAAFSRVDEALAAVKEMHEQLPLAFKDNARRAHITLKAGLHVGPCLAVNANDRLDYFGTTVNLAARVVDCSKGDDVIVTDALYQRPEMAPFLRALGREGEPSELKFRGFDEPHKVWRIRLV
jgi:class 3 adenylate cyclase